MQITSAQVQPGTGCDHHVWNTKPAQCMHRDMKDIKRYHGCSSSYMPSMDLQKKRVVSVHCTFDVRHVSNKTDPSNIPSFLSSNLDIHALVAGEGCWP